MEDRIIQIMGMDSTLFALTESGVVLIRRSGDDGFTYLVKDEKKRELKITYSCNCGEVEL